VWAQTMLTVTLLTSPPENMLPGLGELAKRDQALEAALAVVGFNSQWCEWGSSGSVELARTSSAVVIRSTGTTWTRFSKRTGSSHGCVK
jgi:hypothetical protein